MTRKRFIKLCMSRGLSRNYANVCAAFSRGQGISYDKAYASLQRTLLLQDGVRRVMDILGAALYAINGFVAQLAKNFSRIFEFEKERFL